MGDEQIRKEESLKKILYIWLKEQLNLHTFDALRMIEKAGSVEKLYNDGINLYSNSPLWRIEDEKDIKKAEEKIGRAHV